MIRLTDIRVRYNNRLILDVPLLELKNGKRYGLIGENGSGKTTLLRILAGTLIPDSGTIEGTEAADKMGYLPQAPHAFSISVLENVKMALDQADADQIAKLALEKVGMSALIAARGDKLSGGEKHRMALARLLAKPRELLILDEPSSATDIRGTDIVEALLQDWYQDSRGTLIFSTHSPAQAMRLADEVLFMDAGRIIERGVPSVVFKNPEKAQTISFLSHWRL